MQSSSLGSLGLVLALVGLGGISAAQGATPVACGDILDTPGQYRLTADLVCSGTAVTITGDDVHLNLAGHTISGDGLMCSGPGSSGILVEGASGVHIQGGTVSGFFYGIWMTEVTDSHVNGSVLTQNCVGMILLSSHRNRINGNVVTANFQGVAVGSGSLPGSGSDDNVFSSNELSFQSDFDLAALQAGLFLTSGSDRNRVLGNLVIGNEVGVSNIRGEDNVVQGNFATANIAVGIVAGGLGPPLSSAGTRIQGNTSLQNILFDLVDGNPLIGIPPCQSGASWRDNTFLVDNEGDGPAGGCVR